MCKVFLYLQCTYITNLFPISEHILDSNCIQCMQCTWTTHAERKQGHKILLSKHGIRVHLRNWNKYSHLHTIHNATMLISIYYFTQMTLNPCFTLLNVCAILRSVLKINMTSNPFSPDSGTLWKTANAVVDRRTSCLRNGHRLTHIFHMYRLSCSVVYKYKPTGPGSVVVLVRGVVVVEPVKDSGD